MKKYYIIFVFLFFTILVNGQNYPTKIELKNLFFEKQEFFGENSWKIFNNDSSFFKSDTIILYYKNNLFCFKLTNCCDYVYWTFYNSHKFILTMIDKCENPPKEFYDRRKNPYKFKIIEKNKRLYIKIKDKKKEETVFEVLILTTCIGGFPEITGYGYALTLKRRTDFPK